MARMKARGSVKRLLLSMGKARRGQRDERDLPIFNAPRTGKHVKLQRGRRREGRP